MDDDVHGVPSLSMSSCNCYSGNFLSPPPPRYILKSGWSTLIGRGMSRLDSHWSRASLVMLAPAVLCHKEPARASKAPRGGFGTQNTPIGWYFACSSLVLYGIRLLAPASLGKLSTNESRASTFFDQ